MEYKQPSSKFWSVFTAICGIASIFGWLGISPERIGQLYYDVLHPILPVTTCLFGCLTGWFVRDYTASKHESAHRTKNDELAAEVNSLREKYADERAYTASLLTNIPPEERMTRNQVAEMIENSNAYDDDADAKKLGTSANQVQALSASARNALHKMGEGESAAFRSYLSKCITIFDNGRSYPTWPCNSQGGIPSQYFPSLAIDMQDIDRLVKLGLVGASHRIPISGKTPLRIKLGDERIDIVSKSMLIIKTTGEHVESAFFYPLTDIGTELATLCSVNAADGFAKSVKQYLISNQMQLTSVHTDD